MPEETKPKMPSTIALAFYTTVLIAGLILYFGWSFMFNAWADPGLYSICIVLIGLGLLGVILYGKK